MTLDLIGQGIVDDATQIFARLADLPEQDRIDAINAIRLALREHSPMSREPVDCVLWVPSEQLHANDYNPNSVAAPEMRLLQLSIMADGYCVEADTPVLCADLSWRPAGSLLPGDRLIAFDENSAGTGMTSRRFRTAEVTFNEVREDDLYRVVTGRGDVLTNAEHPWLAQRMRGDSSERVLRWIATKDLMPDDLLVHVVEPWEQDTSWESGWLAGFLDGEGSMAQNQALTHARGYRISAYQRPSPTADRMIKEITNRVQASVYTHVHHQKPKWNDMVMVRVDRFKEVVRLLGTVRPERLIEAGGEFWEGVSIAQQDSRTKVVRVEAAGRGRIASLATSTKTYIAAGFAMHNTQPIVAWPDSDGSYEVVDGFHRNRVAREVGAVRKRVKGRMPIAVINADRTAKEDRVAATIRHNRARGVHQVDAMSDIVVDLTRRGRSDAWIAKELGMEPDEVLRLKQVTGLAELFADREFSEAWEADIAPRR